MLKSVRFLNWKSFRDATLYIDPLTVLIGLNASGKSNALDGIGFLRSLPLMRIEDALLRDRGGAEWAARQGTKRFGLEAVFQARAPNVDHVYHLDIERSPARNGARTRGHVHQVADESLVSVDRRSGESREVWFQTVGARAASLSYRVIDEGPDEDHPRDSAMLGDCLMPREVERALSGLLLLSPVPAWMRGYSPVDESLSEDAGNLAGVLAGLAPSTKRTVEATIRKYARQLGDGDLRRVWAEPVGRLKSDAMLYATEQWQRGRRATVIDAKGMSDGTLRFLAILTAVLTRPSGSLLLVEEVDNGLHPSRAGLLIQALREIGSKRRVDVLVTTHNPALLDAMGPKLVPFVMIAHRDPRTGESHLTPMEDIEDLPKLLAGGTLGQITSRGLLERSLARQGEKKC